MSKPSFIQAPTNGKDSENLERFEFLVVRSIIYTKLVY